jgi:hypothetical protein
MNDQDRVLMNFRITKDVRRKLRTECLKRDTTITDVVSHLIRNQLSHWQRQEGVRPS